MLKNSKYNKVLTVILVIVISNSYTWNYWIISIYGNRLL